ncbi:MAG: NADP-dependent malic enzyme, partial [Alistipes sp.]|nr:NADP-dependent malic enzyme [Alistipes sp.]
LYHSEGRPGKIEVIPTKPYSSQHDLSLAYSPGVAAPCLEIEKNPENAYKYTAKGNLVAVISNGTAVLGLGNIGAMAGKPVMEGKGLLFKTFADIDVFDIEVDATSVEEFIETVKNISPTFGGINLEDIKAPECFEIEERLKSELDIPVMHDDQHGTAIISAAALLNALEITGKKIGEVKVVVNGAGAAAVSCAKLYLTIGVARENMVMCDSKGVINTSREDLNSSKKEFATDRDITTLAQALEGADVFLGLSVADVLTVDMVRSMAANPVVMALANPDPEISYEKAVSSRPDLIFATGRSDYPNQVNNVLGFPYIFRGALDVRATKINEQMKIAAARALAELAKEPVPEMVAAAYGNKPITFGRDYLIPKPLDPRLISHISVAVARAAIESGVARSTITDWEAYREGLEKRMGRDSKLLRSIRTMAVNAPRRRVIFSEGDTDNTVKAAVSLAAEELLTPILVGERHEIDEIALAHRLDLSQVEILDFRT